MKRSLLGLALVLGLLAAVPLVAHHSFSAEFDNQKPVVLKGGVNKNDWTNPHVWIYFNVKDQKGQMTKWGFEMGPPHLLQGRRSNTSLKIGDEIEAGGFLAKPVPRDECQQSGWREVCGNRTAVGRGGPLNNVTGGRHVRLATLTATLLLRRFLLHSVNSLASRLRPARQDRV
jgi:hypothetical protein